MVVPNNNSAVLKLFLWRSKILSLKGVLPELSIVFIWLESVGHCTTCEESNLIQANSYSSNRTGILSAVAFCDLKDDTILERTNAGHHGQSSLSRTKTMSCCKPVKDLVVGIMFVFLCSRGLDLYSNASWKASSRLLFLLLELGCFPHVCNVSNMFSSSLHIFIFFTSTIE